MDTIRSSSVIPGWAGIMPPMSAAQARRPWRDRNRKNNATRRWHWSQTSMAGVSGINRETTADIQHLFAGVGQHFVVVMVVQHVTDPVGQMDGLCFLETTAGDGRGTDPHT